MDRANNNGIIQTSISFVNSYRVANLFGTILEATQVADLKDRYVLGDQLGWGQFGVIRACSDKFTGEVLACKSIAKDRLVTHDDARSIKLEIEILSRLSGHPNVVSLKAVYEEENYVHLLMELCAGGELFHRLEKQGRFSETDAQVLFRHLMQVVNYCHENGVVHRDLKPENILFSTTSSSSLIKLADFGLATYIKPGKHFFSFLLSPSSSLQLQILTYLSLTNHLGALYQQDRNCTGLWEVHFTLLLRYLQEVITSLLMYGVLELFYTFFLVGCLLSGGRLSLKFLML